MYKGYDLTALCLWREARGEGTIGMQAVANVLRNRAERNHTDCDIEVMRPMQFSSMTAPGDRELNLYPQPNEPAWFTAQSLARDVKADVLKDSTLGSTLYYAPASITTKKNIIIGMGEYVPFPQTWNPLHVKYCVTIGKHVFFKEV